MNHSTTGLFAHLLWFYLCCSTSVSGLLLNMFCFSLIFDMLLIFLKINLKFADMICSPCNKGNQHGLATFTHSQSLLGWYVLPSFAYIFLVQAFSLHNVDEHVSSYYLSK